jgi:cytochrome P450
MGSQARFTVTEPEQARQILSDFERFEKPYRRPDARDVIANGLATLNGADWHRHRRITNPAFLAKHLKVINFCTSKPVF